MCLQSLYKVYASLSRANLRQASGRAFCPANASRLLSLLGLARKIDYLRKTLTGRSSAPRHLSPLWPLFAACLPPTCHVRRLTGRSSALIHFSLLLGLSSRPPACGPSATLMSSSSCLLPPPLLGLARKSNALTLVNSHSTLCKVIKIQWHDKNPAVIPRKCTRRKQVKGELHIKQTGQPLSISAKPLP